MPDIIPPGTTTTEGMPALKVPPNPFANPGTPGGFMNRDPNELSFSHNQESGVLEIVGKEQVKELFQAPTDTPKEQEPPKDEAKGDPYEERFQRIEQGILTIGAFLQGQQNGQPKETPKETVPETVDYSGLDMTDANQVAAMFRDIASREIKAQIQPILVKQEQLGVESTYHRATSEFGEEFKQTLPIIKSLAEAGILNSDPNKLDFVHIFNTLKKAGVILPTTAKSDSTIQSVNGTTPSGKPQTAQELVQRAAALSTESPGVQRNLVNTDDAPIKTVDDAFNKAWNDLFNPR